MTIKGRIFERSRWEVERAGSTIVAFPSSEAAHAQAKPRGFRTAGTVIRTDETRSWVLDGDLTIETVVYRRTIEDGPTPPEPEGVFETKGGKAYLDALKSLNLPPDLRATVERLEHDGPTP